MIAMRWSAAWMVALLAGFIALPAIAAKPASPPSPKAPGDAGVAPTSPATAVTAAQVDEALVKAKKYLYAQQKDGNWERTPQRDESDRNFEVSGGQWGGQTALAVFALLVAGEDPQDPRLAKAIEFMLNADIVGTYAIGVRCQALLLLPQNEQVKALMRRDMQHLLGMMRTQGDARGFYDYTAAGKSYSLSRSQYAVLGMWAAAQSGLEIPTNYWTEVERAWIAAQEGNGGWRYQPDKQTYPVTAGITGVGIATLFIVQDQLYATRGIDCKKSTDIPAIEKGIDWLTKNFDRVAPQEKMEREYPQANLYAMERVGVASGLKYFGKHDWYKHGADYLVRRQKKDGSWGGGHSVHSDACFGIIFLSRGRAPVIINKLDWAADDKAAAGNWNRRPREIANLTRWIGRASERDFNWQIMTLDAPLADWHDAPILYLSGSEPLKIDKANQEKMRQYVEEGGMILVHADCGRPAFVSSARKLAHDLFPTYELRELPADHAIYTSRFPRSKWKNKPSVLGVSNGVRELMVLIPQADPGKAWQVGAFRGREDIFQLGADLVFYTLDTSDLRFKGDTHIVVDDPNATTTASLKLARLSYKGNWDPEPGGWRRLRNLLRRDDKLDLIIEPVALGSGSLDGVKIAHLTGTTKLVLDDAAKAQLKKFVTAGGTLIVDAAGGSEAFASSMESSLTSLGVGNGKLAVLPPDHSLYGGKDSLKIAFRRDAQKSMTGQSNAPRLKAIRLGDRPAILFSREDLSAGLVGQPVGGVVGYTPATATELMRRMIRRAAQ